VLDFVLLAKTLVVCKIIVIENRPATHVIDATTMFKSLAKKVMEEDLRLLALSSASIVGQNWQRNYEFAKPDKKGGAYTRP
jgi:hypothetical protein